MILPCKACYGLISSPIKGGIFPKILTIKINSSSLKKKKHFLQSKWLKYKHWHGGRVQGNSFLITKVILQGLRVRLMLKKCWHKLTLEARARHFCSILFFLFSDSYLQDSWNCTIHGHESQIPMADFSGCCHWSHATSNFFLFSSHWGHHHLTSMLLPWSPHWNQSFRLFSLLHITYHYWQLLLFSQ